MIIFIILLFPYKVNFIFLKFVAVIFVRIAVLIFDNINKCGIILIANIILDGKIIKLVEQNFDFSKCRIILVTNNLDLLIIILKCKKTIL